MKRAVKFFWRAIRLRCPECGVSRIFLPVIRTRSWRDWSTPVEKCERCGYAYEREPGYFLPAIWIVHVFTVFIFGLTLGLVADAFWKPSSGMLVVTVCVPMTTFALLFVRHAKAIYLAFDHWIDPQRVGETRPDSKIHSNAKG
jgi:uncharacterized protein (DUF983 family)